jgi:pimeloyl-ACP methyl ester carboxylesterase
MYFERFGTGEESIYLGLHGWGSDRLSFVPLAPFVPPRASFYSADLPGVSLSPAPHAWSVNAVVEEICQTVSALGNPRATIVGHCGGGLFGLLAAIKEEKPIQRIVMIDPFAYLPRYFKIFLNKKIGRMAYQTTFASSFGRWVTNQALGSRRQEKTDLTASFRDADHMTARKYLALFAEMENIEIPQNLNIKIDLIYGEKSFGAVRKSVASLKNRLPHAQIHKLENAAHLPVAEAPGELSRIIFEQ